MLSNRLVSFLLILILLVLLAVFRHESSVPSKVEKAIFPSRFRMTLWNIALCGWGRCPAEAGEYFSLSIKPVEFPCLPSELPGPELGHTWEMKYCCLFPFSWSILSYTGNLAGCMLLFCWKSSLSKQKGLNESFNVVKTHISWKKPLPCQSKTFLSQNTLENTAKKVQNFSR